MLRITSVIGLVAAAMVLCIGAAPALAQSLPCNDSLKARFRPDTLTTVLLVKQFRKGDPLVISEAVAPTTPKAARDLCLVKLNVGPGNPGPVGAPSTSPGIGIEIWLPNPDEWDRRLHVIGGRGGNDGGTHGLTTEVAWLYAALTAMTEGTVSASTDSGHSVGTGAWGTNPDGTLATQLWIDFAHRAQHQMALKTKALALAYYGKPHRYAYYEGSSTGGRHGYRLVQSYPDDYDGVIANLPALNWTELNLEGAYKGLTIRRDLGGKPLTEAQQDLASNAAINACDVVGGQHLGYILDNFSCRYDPTRDKNVLCVGDGGTNRTPDCLTRVQATVINKWWYGMTADGSVPSPAVDNGVAPVLGNKRRWFGTGRGTSLYNVYFSKMFKGLSGAGGAGREGNSATPGIPSNPLGGRAGGAPQRTSAPSDMASIILSQSRFDPPIDHANMSYGDLNRIRDRGMALEPQFANIASDNPDLTKFKARGGKFLSWHGWNDEVIPVQGTMRYYDRVVRRMGGLKNVQSFFKLYVIPGGGHTSPHGTSNPNANPPAVAQFYKLLVDWVEKGIDPGQFEIKSPSTELPVIAQPACPYPKKAVYVAGDPKVAGSYKCS